MRGLILIAIMVALAGCRAALPDPRPVVILQPHEGDRIWSFQESKNELGSGGELQIFIDHETHPHAHASFAKYTLGVGGALPVHRHEKTEEFAYILSGDGAAVVLDDAGQELEVPIGAGVVWYNPPAAWHAVRNKGSTPLSLVFATVPNNEKGLLSFFRLISSRPGEEPVVLPKDEFDRIASEHDMILRAPEIGAD
jgi:mannose-6-phosphate isomerase-like protein (cupin superfamily)